MHSMLNIIVRVKYLVDIFTSHFKEEHKVKMIQISSYNCDIYYNIYN